MGCTRQGKLKNGWHLQSTGESRDADEYSSPLCARRCTDAITYSSLVACHRLLIAPPTHISNMYYDAKPSVTNSPPPHTCGLSTLLQQSRLPTALAVRKTLLINLAAAKCLPMLHLFGDDQPKWRAALSDRARPGGMLANE